MHFTEQNIRLPLTYAGDLKELSNYTLVTKNLALYHTKHSTTKELKASALILKRKEKNIEKAQYHQGLDPETTATMTHHHMLE